MTPDGEWTGPRIDDLAARVGRLEERQDIVRNLMAAHDIQLVEIERRRRVRSGFITAIVIAVITVVMGQIVTIVTLLETPH